MNPYATEILAASRRADYVREAAAEQQAGVARRRTRNPQAEPRSGPRLREVTRPAVA